MIPICVIYLDFFENEYSWKRQRDYEYKDSVEYKMDGIKVWIPKDGDQISYSAFPSTPYKDVLSVTELRGDSLKEGFRVKSEWYDKVINGYGDTK